MVQNLQIVVLAGGRSSRFGSDKSRARVGGERSIDRVVSAAQGVAPVTVVGGERGLVKAEHFWIPDIYPGQGPVQGILSAFRALPASPLLVLACDLPLITQAHLAFMAEDLPSGVHARIPLLEGKPQPLWALYDAQCHEFFERSWSQGIRSMWEVVETLDIQWVRADQLHGKGLDLEAFADFDTPEDLVRLKKRKGV